jgi:tetratricopeptide (TPR) repeat protein
MSKTRDRRTRRPPAAPQRSVTSPPARRLDLRIALIPAAFAAVFVALTIGAYRQTSATWDEPIHVTAGYAALAQQDYRVDPSHPPFLRMWSALPALFMDRVSMGTSTVEDTPPDQWLQDAYLFAHQFLYVDNDADRLLYSARFMTVLLGVVLGIFLFSWTREWLGLLPASIALACVALEPNLRAHSSLVTTDAGVTCFMFGAIYWAWRTCRQVTWGNVAGLTACFALAIVSKFSAVLLAPIVVALLAAAVAQRSQMTARRAVAITCLLAVASFAAVWASYGFRYLPSTSPTWVFNLHETAMAQQAPALAGAVEWLDGHHILPNAFTQGFFYTQTSVQQMPAYLAGEVSASGWWYYFPAAFAMKTPLALMVLLAVGLVAFVRRRHEIGMGNLLFVLLPVGMYLGVAMSTGINIGLRHILPIYPFVILIAAVGATELIRSGRRAGPIAAALAACVWTAEIAGSYPHPLTFFNQLVGGPENGYRYLADSNLGWGQSLKPLKAWMDRNAVQHLNLAYFGQADPAYYGMNVTHLPGAPTFVQDETARPQLPGYVAISATTLTGVYAAPWWRLFYKPFQQLEPVAVVGNSMRIYWIDRWPEAVGASAGDVDVEAHRTLADALLLGYEWPSRAVLHYERYLDERPNDVGALVNYGIALVAADRVSEGMEALQRGVDADGSHGPARLMLGKALFASRDIIGADAHAERAVALLPQDADAHHLLGRVRAVQGRLDDAAREFRQVLQIQPQHAEARELLRRVTDALPAGLRPTRSR